MCGIIGYTGRRDAVDVVLAGLRRLEYRGYDSAGVVVLDADRPQVSARLRAQGKIDALDALVRADPPSGRTAVGHTRWATHGRPSEANAHPHKAGRVCVVHNGIIENHGDLRRALIESGCVFSSETDSEVIAHLIERELVAGAKDLHLAVRAAVTHLRGAWAVCAVSDDEPDTIVAARRFSPLLIGLGEATGSSPDTTPGDPHERFVASDVAAILAWTRQVIDLEDGDVVAIAPGQLSIRDLHDREVTRPRRRVEWSLAAAEKQGFRHFMLKEIFEQPRAVHDTLAGRQDSDALVFALASAPRISIVGCGTSWHAGLVGRRFIETLARIPVDVDVASEFRYRDPILGPGDALIAISQSGETADTLAAVAEAKRRGAVTAAICNVVDSSIARAVDVVAYTHAGPEISVASTKAFSTQLAVLTRLAIDLGRARGTLDADRQASLLEELRNVPSAIETVLEEGPLIRAIARRYLAARDVLFLGRGVHHPVALEGALKLKEISYVHAEGYAAGEMKHGPIALIDDEVPVVILCPQGATYDKTVSNLEEVRARGGRVLAIATRGDTRVPELADDVIFIPPAHEIIQPMLAVIPLQLLAYHFADLKGTDVDQPRNLAKSVTVE